MDVILYKLQVAAFIQAVLLNNMSSDVYYVLGLVLLFKPFI